MKKIMILLLSGCLSVHTFSQRVEAVKAADLSRIIAESKTPLVVNMWATWCKPCIEELPYFQKEISNHQKDSVRLLLVSLDFKESFPVAIKAFAKKRKITAPILFLDETNADYFCPLVDKKWSGAIPATLFINNKTGYRNFIEDQLSPEKLKIEIEMLIKR